MLDTPKPRPSSAHRWGNGCTASVALEAEYPREETEVAAEGTRLHDLGARVLLGELDRSELASEDWQALKLYVEDVEATLAKCSASARLDIERTRSDGKIEGTPDCSLYDPVTQTLYVWDYKSGWLVVEAERNLQLACYAMLCLEEFPGANRFVGRIVQPRTWHDEGKVRSWEPSMQDLHAIRYRLGQHIDEVRGPREYQKTVTGPHCRYCDAAHVCQALRKEGLAIAETADAYPRELPPEHMAAELQLLRDGERQLALRRAALEAEMTSRIRAGTICSSARLARGRQGNLAWKDPATVADVVQLLTGNDIRETKLPTPRQAMDAGVPAEVVNAIAGRGPGKEKLKLDLEGKLFEKLFGEPSNPTNTGRKAK